MYILSIETSCDETAAAVLHSTPNNSELLSSIVSSQVKLHAQWGGVVPNLAAREHLKNIMPIIGEALKKANILQKNISLIAVTNGPGLIPALLIGVEVAKALSYLWHVPLIGIHHIEGHIYANFIPFKQDKVREISNFNFQLSNEFQNPNDKNFKTSKNQESLNSEIKFPLLCLVVSGGHTQLILMKKHLNYKIIGETQDDAVGEAFDKVSRILGLGYPGGPIISAKAEKFQMKSEISLPRPMINSKDFNFSFSGLKTAVLYLTKKNIEKLQNENFVCEIASEFQSAAVEVLVKKTIAAAKKFKAKTVILSGGVSANLVLRKCLSETVEKELVNVVCLLPEIKYTGDNAAMIAAAAHFRFHNTKNKHNLKNNWKNLEANANLKLENL